MQIYLHCFNKMCGFSRKFYMILHKRRQIFLVTSDSACYAFPRNYSRTVVQITRFSTKYSNIFDFLRKILVYSKYF